MSPLVCIILVNYNGFEDTVDCLKSLKEISYDNYKIIVVDNGSTRDVENKSLSYIRDNSYYLEINENVGFSGGNNYGIKYASQFEPEYYLLLNNDTIVKPDFLDRLVFSNHDIKKVGIITGRILFYTLPNKIWFAGGTTNPDSMKTDHIGYMDNDGERYCQDHFISFATGCLWLLPKRTIDVVGILDEKYFLYCEDTDYCQRVLASDLKILYIGNSCIYHKVSASTGNNSDLQNYYIVRNTFFLIDTFANKKKKAKALCFLRFFKLVFSKKIKFRVFLRSLLDYRRGKYGR